MVSINSIVESSAKIGNNVEIGHFSFIGPDVVIGDNTYIGNNVTITGHTHIGEGNRILDGTKIGFEPQHLLFYSSISVPTFNKHKIVIGNNNIIRENCTIHQPYTSDMTSIGDNNFFMVNTHIAHDCIVYDNTIIANNVILGGHCEVDAYANIGLNTCVHQYTHIGKYSMVGMGSVVNKDVLPFHLIVGSRNDMKVSINVIGYGRNYKGSISLSTIKEVRLDGYGKRSEIRNLELKAILENFIGDTKNGIYY